MELQPAQRVSTTRCRLIENSTSQAASFASIDSSSLPLAKMDNHGFLSVGVVTASARLPSTAESVGDVETGGGS